MRADGCGADHVESEFVGYLACFCVEVVDDFHVVGDEADGRDDNVIGALRFQLAQVVADVRLKPALRRRPRTALEDETPTLVPRAFGDEAARLKQLTQVVTARGHRRGDAVRREGYTRRRAPLRRDSFERGTQVLDVRPDEAGVVVEGAQLLDARGVTAYVYASAFDVFSVLSATGVRTVGRRDEGERVLDSVVAHLSDCVGEKRVPVSVAPVDGKARPVLFKLALQSLDEFPVLFVDGTDAAEQLVRQCLLTQITRYIGAEVEGPRR